MEGSFKYRVKYKKYGAMKFLGHLDVLRFFQKAIKRSGLPIAYSEGFNPHQLLSFAAPLSVGVGSEGEYFDMELYEKTDEATVTEALGGAMVEGVEIVSARYQNEKIQNAMAAVSAASYSLYFDGDVAPDFYDFIDKSSHINIVKKTKKSEREIDLKPLVYECKRDADGIYIVLPCGSKENIKPSLLVDAYSDSTEKKDIRFSIYRRDLYMGTFPGLKSLMDF